MVSKSQIKLITALQQKKFRKEHQLFFTEGNKVTREFLDSGFRLHSFFSTGEDFSAVPANRFFEATEADMKKMSALTTPPGLLAVFEMPAEKRVLHNALILALDGISDPGNLGTLVRLCDWFGIQNLVCSPNCVDAYNPKAVQASMGSLARVNVVYRNLDEFLEETTLPVFGTFMDGDNIYRQSLPEAGVIVMGSEANGISGEVERLVTQKIAIPRFGDIRKTESLNVATAAAIILSEFCRSTNGK